MRRFAIVFGFALVVAACGDSGGVPAATTPTTAAPSGTATTAAGTMPSQTTSASGEDEVLRGAAVLDEFRDRCAAGNLPMCDLLFFASEFGSADEAFGDTCGERVEPDGDFCVAQFGLDRDIDAHRAGCQDLDMVSCDLLFLYSDFDSIDEAFGAECGGLGKSEGVTSCAVEHGWVP